MHINIKLRNSGWDLGHAWDVLLANCYPDNAYHEAYRAQE